MRASDEKKNTFANSHDRQISDTLHDRIVVWLFEQLSSLDSCPGFISKQIMYSKYVCNYVSHKVFLEAPVEKRTYSGLQAVGFIDVAVRLTYKADPPNDFEVGVYAGIEVKSRINVGETMRQINFYRSATINKADESMGFVRLQDFYLVCAPGEQHVKLFESQDVGYIAAPF